jgi:predicted anti-sigma-YlaC factor YlaD
MRTSRLTAVAGWAAAAVLVVAVWASLEDWHTDEMGNFAGGVLPTFLTGFAVVDFTAGIVLTRRGAGLGWFVFVTAIALAVAAIWYHVAVLS